MFDGEVVVVEVLVVPEMHVDVLVVPVVDDLLLVDVYEVHEVTMVVLRANVRLVLEAW
jgi:hypothetical protein